MLLRFRVSRSPLAAEAAGGTMTVSAPAEKAADSATPSGAAGDAADAPDPKAAAAPKEGEEKADKPVAKAEPTDWDVYQKMQAKFAKNPNARATKRELELREKYEGKDEKLIEGWKPQDTPQAQDEDAAPAADPGDAEPKEKPAAPAIPKELEDLVGEKSPLGVKSLADLAPKVRTMMQKIERMNGDFGAVGRIMQEAGVENLGALKEEIRGAKRLHTLVQDLRAGKPEALKFIGLDKGIPGARPTRAEDAGAAGELPEGVLDETLAHHFQTQLRARDTEIADLKRMLQEKLRDVDGWKQHQERTLADTQRAQQVADVIKDVNTLVQSAEGLWDAKKHGPLNRALEEYYGSKDGDAYNPGLERILQILKIAKEEGLQNLAIAHAYWERENRALLLREAGERARQPFTGKQPSVGLSDQQGAHNGQFKEYTRTQVLNMGKKGYPPVPSEWTDETGTFIPSKVPAYVRPWLFGDNEE